MAQEKEYTGTITLGAVTPTYDLESEPEGRVLGQLERGEFRLGDGDLIDADIAFLLDSDPKKRKGGKKCAEYVKRCTVRIFHHAKLMAVCIPGSHFHQKRGETCR